jgi:hypothetical protein
MKNYPNQASSFRRIRGTLAVIEKLNVVGADVGDDGVLGYAAAQEGVYTFRSLGLPTAAQLAKRIAEEKLKPSGNQGPRTFARELRRTLHDMGWLDAAGLITPEGNSVLVSIPYSIAEQSLLVAGLLNIAVEDENGNVHHPVQVMLKLLAVRASEHRNGLELALETKDDSPSEFTRVEALYKIPRADRISALSITDYQRANAVKVFPALAVQAGLVIDGSGVYALSQDGWSVLGRTPPAARQKIARRPGRRTTVGKLVDSKSAAKRIPSSVPKMLSREEQERANERLRERTAEHQQLVRRIAMLIGDDDGKMFEDEFSYDLFWAPGSAMTDGWLYEMKTIRGDVDAYKRVRDTVGQLGYYDYFHVAPSWSERKIHRVTVFDQDVPIELAEYLTHEGIGAVTIDKDGMARALNSLGQAALNALPPKPDVP